MGTVTARRWTVLLLLATLLSAGCLGTFNPADGELNQTSAPGNGTAGNDTNSSQNGTEDPPDDSGSENRSNDTQAPPGNEGDPPDQAYPPWPPVEQATVRPGVQVVADGAQCTSNFLFRSPGNTTLYLGLAAHCVDTIDLGDEVTISSGRASGTLAYSGWADGADGLDFALIAISSEDRPSTHPAMLHFGGPVGLATPDDVATGDKILFYGNTGLNPGAEEARWHEGYVATKNGESTFNMYATPPGVSGDSGSGVMTGDGRAVGALNTIEIAPRAGSNGVAFLSTGMQQAAQAGVPVELVTWQLFDQGLLP